MSFQERYKYNPNKDLLGKGGFARVYKATDILLDREVAIKVFNATDKGQYTVIEEIKKAIKLQHPNLLRYFDVAIIENTNALGETDTLQIGVMELANAGDLKQFAKNNPNSPKLFVLLQQVLSGLEYLHHKGIIHRDLKPQNILLVEEDGEYTAKISDFGISKSMDSGTNSASMAIGTIEYMAPEQFNPAKYGINGKIGTNVDLWSFGIMVHELLTNEPLFGQRSGNTTAEQIMNAILSPELPDDIELLKEPYKSIVKKCLISDAKLRIQKANEIINLFNVSEVQTDNQETVQIDKSLLDKINKNNSAENEVKSTIAKNEKEKPLEENEFEPDSKKGGSLKYVLIGGLLLLLSLGLWYWKTSKNEADKEYSLAFQSIPHSKDYMLHMENAARLNKDSANWQLAGYYFDKEQFKNALPYIKKLVDTINHKPVSNLPHVAAIYAKILLKEKNDPKDAIKILKDCTATGDADCAFELGMLYYDGKSIEQSYAEAIKLFNQAAEKNNDKAQGMLGYIYFMGLGAPLNYSKAIENYYKAASNGNPIAMYSLGLAYANGLGVNVNNEEAVKWFKEVVKSGNNPEVVAAAQKMIQDLQ